MRLGGPFARLLSVHPLGGCAMGRSAEEGVVDSYGRVFGYERLYVVRRLDPARPGGRQPEHDHRRPGRADRGGAAGMSALQWSESMRGRVSFDTTDYNQGWWHGTPCSFHLDRARSTTSSASSPTTSTRRRARGWIDCDGLGERMTIAEGTFNLLVAAGGPRRREMRYRLFAARSRRAPGDARGGQERRGRLVPRHVGRHDDAVHAPVPGLGRARRGGRRDPAGHGRPARLRRRLPGPDAEHARPACPTSCATARSSPARCCRSTSAARTAAGSTDFPGLDPGAERWQGFAPEQWHDCPGRPGLRRRILGVRTEDGRQLTLHHIRGEAEPTEGPVLLAARHGRAREPVPRRADPALDRRRARGRRLRRLARQLARLDRPARVRLHARRGRALRPPGADRGRPARDRAQTLKAVVHCQGSTSFALACAGGLVPEVTDVVSNAVSFHVDVPPLSKLQMQMLLPAAVGRLPRLRPAVDAPARPRCAARLLARGRAPVRRECREPVCQMANYTYGVGGNILWDHANIDPPTHRWIAREFGWVPTTFFRQMSRCAGAGHLVAASGFDELPDDVVSSPPRNRPRWTFLAGSANRCFLPRSQERSFAWLDSLEPGRHALVEVPGYTHLDLFFGRDAERDVFGHVRDALLRGTSNPRGS